MCYWGYDRITNLRPMASLRPAANVRLGWLLGVVLAATAAAPATARIAAPEGAGSGSLIGAVWTQANEPVPDVIVRLRSVVSRRIERFALANELGRFEFRDLEGGQYIVEVVGEDGKLLAVGHPLSLAPGETVATFVRLGMRIPWLSGFFNNAAAAAVSTAANLGLTAVRAAEQQVSPDRP